ncbi:hypothetical protein B0H66DRAFT_322260 [Apodospora peruviana]|uniref:Uncharacterized protein n=1 Tax=Apodospora peruviana TaxID=516989 RepID=A0AAE0HYC4_9PEZI|nr:hypothetical protein B0H66DRAFT_322260 [Apodospora peruviana]
MPKQYVLFGRPVPRLGTRHTSLLLVTISLFAVFSLFFMLPSAIPTGPSLQIADHKFSIPKSFKSPWKSMSPWKAPAHEPPRQMNDTSGETSWYSNWKWLSYPFSSSVTLDENRLLLPDLLERTPIYCYYDNTLEKDKESREVESDLLLSWRRAWWAQGFKPIILGPADAMKNSKYEELQKLLPEKKLDPTLMTDLMRWLAWENMGGGLLAHYLLFPMGAYNDPLLTFLRRGEYPKLTRWKDLDEGLFAAPKADVAAAVTLATASPKLKSAKDFLESIGADKENAFAVDEPPKSLAFYGARQLAAKYSKVAEAITASHVKGFTALNQLINSHLHLTWQNLFSSGIAVVKPLPHHTTHMISPAYELALRLTHCPESPLPSSCPPNLLKCSPCVAAHPMKVSTPSNYENTSTLYTIGTVPHPYTAASLSSLREEISISWIRRDSPRDPWLGDLTKRVLGTGVSGGPRVLRFKQAVASELGAAHSLWLLAERKLPEDLVNWHFGFPVPTEATWADEGKSETPVPGPERRPPPPPHDPKDGPIATPEELALEPALLSKALTVVGDAKGKLKATKEQVAVREAIEAWNLADTEAWRFARAFLARKAVEREKWEEEEAKYADGMGSEKKPRAGSSSGVLDRWLDRGSSKDKKD